MLSKAISIAAVAFEGRYDKGGSPYILHCLYVMDKVKRLGDNYAIVAVLHDLVEDTKWTIQDLRDLGFNEEILKALDLMTHKDGVSYDDYIKGISTDVIATACKRSDLEHNMKASRLKGMRKKDFERLEKYIRAFAYLG